MTEEYDLAKPNPWFHPERNPEAEPFAVEPDTGLPPFMVDVELPDVREDLTGFVPGRDRMLTGPEFLERSRGHQPPDGPPVDMEEQNRLLFGEVEYLRAKLVQLHSKPITSETSDGYHTFRELYDHRRALTAALAEMVTRFVWREQSAWRSREHHPEDGPMFDDSFIVGIDLPTGSIRYHYKNQYWDDFKNVPELEHAPRWDGAGPEATVTRLIDYARS